MIEYNYGFLGVSSELPVTCPNCLSVLCVNCIYEQIALSNQRNQLNFVQCPLCDKIVYTTVIEEITDDDLMIQLGDYVYEEFMHLQNNEVQEQCSPFYIVNMFRRL